MPCTISTIPSPVVAYCQRCHLPIHEQDPSWRVADDDILCPHFNVHKLVFCSKDCLERTMESVLSQIKRFNGDSKTRN